MSTPKARSMGNAGTTADSHEGESEKPTVSSDNRDANVGQREADAESDGGGKDSPPGQRAIEEDNREPGGKQTIESSREEASLGQRPTRDDGDNDDEGELK